MFILITTVTVAGCICTVGMFATDSQLLVPMQFVIFALFSRYVHVHVQCESDSFYGNVVRLSTLNLLYNSIPYRAIVAKLLNNLRETKLKIYKSVFVSAVVSSKLFQEKG